MRYKRKREVLAGMHFGIDRLFFWIEILLLRRKLRPRLERDGGEKEIR
jgi:hypothetical protein